MGNSGESFLQAAAKAARKKKKKTKPHWAVDYGAYLLIRTVAVFIQMVPVDTALRLARWLGGGLYVIYGRGRERALENLGHSYPEKSQAWRERTAKRSFEHLVMFAFDMLYVGRLIGNSTWHRYLELGDFSEVLRLILSGRGVIMITGHYGNFEVLGCAMDAFGLHTYNIARPIDNPYINRYVYTTLHRGQTIIYKKGASDEMHRILTDGGTLGIVGDQNGKHKDIFVDFFGRKAATYKSVALMAISYNAPIVIGSARRIGDAFRFAIDKPRVIMPEDWAEKDDALGWITAEWTRAIEDFVRVDPEQYWWVHRRWRTRPAAERQEMAAVGEVSQSRG